MRKFMLLATLVGAVACERGICSPSFNACLTDEEIQDIYSTPPISVTPTAAKLAVGESVVFQVTGGVEPLTVQVMGCLFGAASCGYYAIDTEHNPATGAFLIEYLDKDRRIIRVMFLTRENQPTSASLYVFGRGRTGIRDNSALVPIELVD